MDEVFIDSDGKIKKSSMVDEHSLIKITEKTPELTNIGKIVRGDTNSNILTFEINRYYDGEDVYGKNIRFIIKNSLGIYTEEAVNLQYSDKHIRFSWILSYADTHSGAVTAAIEFYGKNDEGYPYSLKTTTFSFNPADTLDATDMVVDVPNWFVDVENRLTNLEENGGVADLVKLIGTLPEGEETKTIIEYIDSKIDSVDFSEAIADAKKAGTDAQTAVSNLEKRVETLENTTFVEATDAEIEALFS